MGITPFVTRHLEKLYEAEMDGLRSFRKTQSRYLLISEYCLSSCFTHLMEADCIACIVIAMDKFTVPFILFCAAVCTTLENGLQPSTLFPSLLLLSLLKTRLLTILRAHQRYTTMANAYNCIQDYLKVEEFHATTTNTRLIHIAIKHCMFNDSPVTPDSAMLAEIRRPAPNDDPLQLLNATVTLPGAPAPLFTNVSVSIPKEKLTVVVGIKGSGRSELLKVFLGEISRTTGQLYIRPGTTIAFCGQPVWVQYQSIRQNIVGDHPFKRNRYLDILRRCQLAEDLAILPDGDNTKIATNIISLTTSQKCKMVNIIVLYLSTF